MKSIRQLAVQEAESGALLLTESAGPRVRPRRGTNWRGLWTLTLKEVKRFLKIGGQTVVSPIVMVALFFAVFSMATGDSARIVGGVPFLHFLIPGLLMMTMAQAAFMNTSASLILSKLQNNIVDLLMAPLSPFELTTGYAMGGLARGLVVGAACFGVLFLFAPVGIAHFWAVFYYAAMGSLMLSLIGLVTGIWGSDFDHMGAVQNFIVMPATFLSGTFFSVSQLPEGWLWVIVYNPFFYMIDGFRYGFTGQAEGDILGGAAILLFVNMLLFHVAYWMFARSSHLRN